MDQNWLKLSFFDGKSIQKGESSHTAGSDTIFVQIYMNALPGVPGVLKNQIFFSQIKLLSFCTNIASKRYKLQKSSKLIKKKSKKTCFLIVF